MYRYINKEGQEKRGCKKTAQIKKTTNLSKKDRQVVFFVV